MGGWGVGWRALGALGNVVAVCWKEGFLGRRGPLDGRGAGGDWMCIVC